ncbi:tetratricopeptide repeat protein [Streptomyces sp. R21]|uniref:Tetratricopeptide repeat protein n=1 Tax=Streptomyces sp. R21 TaxID=3238627 RepID=A0AB39PCM8_9ACTN
MAQDLQQLGEELVAAARGGDTENARRITRHFVLNHHIDEAIPFWERAAEAGDAFAAFNLARYRKTRGDRAEAERLYRSRAEDDSGCAYGLGVLLREDRNPEAERWFRYGWETFRYLDCKIELGKGMARAGRIDEAAEFLMSGIELGDIAVFRWAQLYEGVRKQLDQVDAALRDAEERGDAGAADEAIGPLHDLRRELKDYRDYPGLLPEIEAYHRRADALSPAALVHHAILLHYAVGEEDRMPEIRELLVRAHEKGDTDAAAVLGLVHEARAELADAERWYTVGAEAGNPNARWNLALLCKRQRRLDEAERWFTSIADVDEDVPDQLDALARIRESGAQTGKDLRRLPGLRERAEAGDAQAAYAFGRIAYEWGGASERHMIRWYEPAARQGDPEAAYWMGKFHAELREPEARDLWYLRAAEGGHPGACFERGWLAEHHKDYREAERWYDRAADDGNGLAAMIAGKLRAQRGAWTEAEPLLRRAYMEAGDGEGPEYAVEAAAYHGLVLNRLGRPAEAVEPLRFAAPRWDEVRRRYDRDDLALLARTVDPEEELRRAEAAQAAG